MKRFLTICLALIAMIASGQSALAAQGVTTGSITGTVTHNGAPVAGATVTAAHVSSGTRYGSMTRADGRYSIPNMRVGGPYTVTMTHIGFETETATNIFVNLGTGTNVDFAVRERAVRVEGITVTATRDAILNSERTGAATTVSREALATLPTINRRIEDFARLSPHYSGGPFGFSFAGQDNRLNNMTVDGSYFNNSFGLAGQPGDRTDVAPISLQAIEQVQVNIAPFDVRQGNFVGAGVNTVTRSGTNDLRGSLYYEFRNEGMVGKEAKGIAFDPGTFNFKNLGGWLSGPIVRDKVFYFVNYENESDTRPLTTFRANRGGETVEGSVTRVLQSDLDQLSSFLKTNFNYDTGRYQGYDDETPATRFLAKVDFNLNEKNKLSLRYNHLDSRTDVGASTSSSLGFGNRRGNRNALNFENSNYIILENIRSIVGEWNAVIGQNMANNLILGYSYHDESRDSKGTFFPMVDILSGGSTYTTFGFEPFTPSNELRYGSYQLQNNFSIFGENHTLTLGLSAERYESENIFFPGSQSVYVYNALGDFYTDANGYLANQNRTTSPVTLRRFQVRWSNIPGQDKPVQPLEVLYTGLYGQDEWRVTDKLKLTLGLRVDVPFFGETGFANPEVDGMNFRDETGATVKYSTSKLPDPNPLLSPRVGFNYDVTGDRSTQIRGGTGLFTGRPAYVWISNQIGENGILTGFLQQDNTRNFPFHPDPNRYKPASVNGTPASSYGLAFSDENFKFPQLWRTTVAVDHRLPLGLIGTAEFLYSKDVNGIYYINANLSQPNSKFSGPDNRPRWTGSNRINSKITSAIVLKNQNEGSSWIAAGSLERPFSNGLYLKGAYSYGEAKNTVDPGSIAFGSWNNNEHAGDPNNPGTGFSSNSPGHRVLAAASYRREWFSFGATSVSLFFEGRSGGNGSYVFSGDLNGDGGTSNDLIYIHRDISEMNFEQFSASGRTFTAAEQAQAWDAFIRQDPYLSKHRGEYAQRGAIFLPMEWVADFAVEQELFTQISGRRNALKIRADILNFTNLLNQNWGVGQRRITNTPLISRGASPDGRPLYRLRNEGTELISKSFEPSAGPADVYRIQLSLRYTFN